MAQAVLKQILDQLPRLEQAELQQLSQMVQSYLRDQEAAAKRTAFHQALLEAGIVRQIKPPVLPSEARQPLIQVQGGAVSQTIIEERR